MKGLQFGNQLAVFFTAFACFVTAAVDQLEWCDAFDRNVNKSKQNMDPFVERESYTTLLGV